MHTSWIRAIDFSTDSSLMRSCSRAADLLLWTLPDCKRINQLIMARDVEWASCTCAVSWEARGVWEEGCDLSALTCLQRTPTGLKGEALLFSGDRDGFLKVFPWPAAGSMQVMIHLRLSFLSMPCDSSSMHTTYSFIVGTGVDGLRWSQPRCFIAFNRLQRRLRRQVTCIPHLRNPCLKTQHL